MENVPRPDAVLNDWAPILPIIHEGLEKGAAQALHFFDQLKEGHQRPIDPHLAAYLTRFYTRIKLREEGHNVENGESCGEYKLNYVPNCGLYLAYKQYKAKIFKSKNSEVPIPGNSLSKQRYYEQMDFFPNLEGTNNCWNLILLWEVKPPYLLDSLSIACPQSGGRTKNSVIMHWHVLVPPAYLYGIEPSSSDSSAPTRQAQDIEDLEKVTLKKEIEVEIDNII